MNGADDRKWRNMLRRHDFVPPPEFAGLAALERRIMAEVDALPEGYIPSVIPFAPWTLGGTWAVRGACLAAALFVLLGFLVGREFDALSFQTADSSALFASADATPWQSFITSPSSGETDDAQ